MEEQNKPQLAGSKIIAATVAAWFIYLSIDFLIHAVILATWWKKTADYWLSPEDLFRLIPIGYASFAIYCGALTWLFVRTERCDAIYQKSCPKCSYQGKNSSNRNI